jgi:hypothetical protein
MNKDQVAGVPVERLPVRSPSVDASIAAVPDIPSRQLWRRWNPYLEPSSMRVQLTCP